MVSNILRWTATCELNAPLVNMQILKQCAILLLLTALLWPLKSLAMIDADSDGMSDVWEKLYHAESLNPVDDDDGDGQSNIDESIAGTDPLSSTSFLGITSSQYHSMASVIQWQSVDGAKYMLQKSNLLIGAWSDVGLPVIGHGGLMTSIDYQSTSERCFYRISLLGQLNPASFPDRTTALIGSLDTDDDGIDDLTEIVNGLNPFDMRNSVPTLHVSRGKAMHLSWSSIEGKSYQIQLADNPAASWTDVGEPHKGNGQIITTAVSFLGQNFKYVRVVVNDVDRDNDGVTDWEELQAGLSSDTPHTDTQGLGDYLELSNRLINQSVITVGSNTAVANITSLENGVFEILRQGGIDELTVTYLISGTATAGSDYVPLSGTVTIPFGENSAIVSLQPLASSPMALSESVILTLQNSADYNLGAEITENINVIKEVVIDVTNYGAVGDGVVDDTLAIQAAIDALESSSSHNTLHFPTGTYRLNTTYYTAHSTGTSHYRILKLGNQDLAGRDLVMRGAVGAKLYSTTSPLRAKILLAMGSFRSLSFQDMHWEKDESPLSQVQSGAEPNGAAGVALINIDDREIKNVNFLRCSFSNCHRSITVGVAPYARNGLLRAMIFKECEFLNPYGANTMNGQQAYGGGQQIFISPWVDYAHYENNYFMGRSVDANSVNNPGGRKKDGCHFGSPRTLIFKNNVVENMGIEAVFLNNYTSYLGTVSSSSVVPPADGTTEFTINVNFDVTPLSVGNHINIKTGLGESNNVFRIVSYSVGEKKITMVNDGFSQNSAPGTALASNRPCYLQEAGKSYAKVECNVLVNSAYGIVINAATVIKRNILYNSGIRMYAEFYTPMYPADSRALIVKNVLFSNNSVGAQYYSNAVMTEGSYHRITSNILGVRVAHKYRGIYLNGPNNWAENNSVVALNPMNNGYNSSERSEGISFRSGATSCRYIRNVTSGFDVGVGPAIPHLVVPHYVADHVSENDVLGVDWRGLIDE